MDQLHLQLSIPMYTWLQIIMTHMALLVIYISLMLAILPIRSW